MPAVVGGLTWERRPVDPLPGPRPLDVCHGVDRLHEAAAPARPEAGGGGGTAHPFRFAEGRVAELLGEPTVLVDPTPDGLLDELGGHGEVLFAGSWFVVVKLTP